MRKSRSILLILGTIVFAAFASLQFNDATQYGNHDPWAWIALYALMAILSLTALYKRLPESLLTSWAGFSWGALFFRLQDDFGNFKLERLDPSTYWNDQGTEMVQVSNESGGLLIMALFATLVIFLNRLK